MVYDNLFKTSVILHIKVNKECGIKFFYTRFHLENVNFENLSVYSTTNRFHLHNSFSESRSSFKKQLLLYHFDLFGTRIYFIHEFLNARIVDMTKSIILNTKPRMVNFNCTFSIYFCTRITPFRIASSMRCQSENFY